MNATINTLISKKSHFAGVILEGMKNGKKMMFMVVLLRGEMGERIQKPTKIQ